MLDKSNDFHRTAHGSASTGGASLLAWADVGCDRVMVGAKRRTARMGIRAGNFGTDFEDGIHNSKCLMLIPDTVPGTPMVSFVGGDPFVKFSTQTETYKISPN